VIEAADIFIGVNALDYSGYPDCRPEHIAVCERMARLATKAGVEGKTQLKIHAPLIALTKAQIIRKGWDLGVDYGQTRTCYDPSPSEEACGACDACLLRLKGFAEAGAKDPAPYRAGGNPQMRSTIKEILSAPELRRYMRVIIIRSLRSWVSPDPRNPIVQKLIRIMQPGLNSIRRQLPCWGMRLHLSLMISFLDFSFLQILVVRSLGELMWWFGSVG